MTECRRPHYVIGSAVIVFEPESFRHRVVARLSPETVEFQRRFDAGEKVDAGEYEYVRQGSPEFELWKTPEEDAAIRGFVQRSMAIFDQRRRG